MDYESSAQELPFEQKTKLPELSRHIVVLANPTPVKKMILSEMIADFSTMSTDPIEFDQKQAPVEMLQTKVDEECKWMAGYLPRDNAGDRYVTIISVANIVQMEGRIIIPSPKREENIRLITAMAGKSIKITSVLRVVSVAEDPSFAWSRNHVTESVANISAMVPSVVEEYVESADFKRLDQENCFFSAESRWVTSVFGSESNLSGLPKGNLSMIIDELVKLP